jgi:predicted ATPase/DNA-binding CsgD family transcriptional regulator
VLTGTIGQVVTRGTPLEVGVSAREAQVLAALGEHLTNVEIGSRLFISTRTVESHVSSLLRKLQVNDRRALAVLATSAPVARRTVRALVTLPSPLTAFVGRVTERAALVAALDEHREHRLVTAVGPGGVGKTRLALQVASEVADRFPDGVWYVDLVPVTDPVMVAPAIADVLGLGEQPGRSPMDNLLGWFAERETLLVLDNCEHLLDSVVVVLEQLLTSSPGLVVLATSRSRLLVPFEWVFPVPGLSVDTDGGSGDAVELFLDRAAAGGRAVTAADRSRIAAVCTGLDGMALAIELAAARFASLGLDGLEAGLGDRLRLLTGGRRIDDRHRSLRSTLDWSYALLNAADQALLRRVSVFAVPFTADAAAAMLGAWSPVTAGAVSTILATLADQSLLIAIGGPGGTRYRVLETIRQYGVDRLDEAGELGSARSRHLHWCLDRCTTLLAAPKGSDGFRAVPQRAPFELVADELRAALGWAATDGRYRRESYALANGLAELSFGHGTPGEAQRRYEQAAALAPDGRSAAAAFRSAAGAAESRHVGNDAFRLRACAVDAAKRAGDRAGAARDLARNAELIYRAPGLMATAIDPDQAVGLIAEGWDLAGSDESAQSRLLTAEAFDPRIEAGRSVELVGRALEFARRAGDRLSESAALDQLTSSQLARGEVRAAAASARQRTELLAAHPMSADSGLEFFDSFVMAAECAVSAGDLPGARNFAECLRDLPFYREEGHLATSRLLVVTALAGDWAETVNLAARYYEGWQRAGRPRAGNLSRGAYAAATVFGMRGDEPARASWLDVVAALTTTGIPLRQVHFGEFFDALLLLHQGRADEAVEVLQSAPEELNEWHSGMWRPWYAAMWAEAAVLTDHPGVADRLQRARTAATGNPIATAIVNRAAALAGRYPGQNGRGGDRAGLAAAAAALQKAGCHYQWARTLVFIGGEERARGESVLAAMGATAMAAPPE